ncbi:hypothetical protein [Nonomuraea sp. NPDC052265]|uniref:hypothetical protein n=1 Tax=Nonomuraea sp. NPDC052265 TaxID=3364374 RepID=UPI0037C5F357
MTPSQGTTSTVPSTVINTDTFRRTAAGLGLVLTARAFPAAAQAATTRVVAGRATGRTTW